MLPSTSDMSEYPVCVASSFLDLKTYAYLVSQNVVDQKVVEYCAQTLINFTSN